MGGGVWGPQCAGSTVWIVLHRGPSRPAVTLVSCVRAVSLETVNRVHILALFIDYYMAAVCRPSVGTGTFCSRTDRGICCAPVWNNEELQLAGGGARPTLVLRSVRMHARTSDDTQAAGLAKAFAATADCHHQLPRPGARA